MTMVQTVISAIAIFSAVCYPLYSLVKRDRGVANYFLFAALATAAAVELFDLWAISQPDLMTEWKTFALVAEAFLPPCWLLYTTTYARENGLRSISLWQRLLLLLSLLLVVSLRLLPTEALFYSPDFGAERLLFLKSMGFFFYLAMSICLVIALINLEITFAGAPRSARWNIKFEILGAGSLLAALILYYSQGLIYRTINMNLMPVRTAGLLAAVILIAYSQWRSKSEARIQLSRNIVYKSMVLLAVGLYLIVLGVMGEGMRYFGESFQRSMVMALFFVAGIGVITVLLSETAKRKIKVFLIKNFYQNKYDYREQWLQFTDRLSSASTNDQFLTGILAGYCETFGMGCGALFLIECEPGDFSLLAGLEIEPFETGISRKDPLIGYMAEKRWVIIMEEENPSPGEEFGRFLRENDASLVIPLFLNDAMEGFIVLGRTLSRNEKYNFEDLDLLKALAHQTSSVLQNRRLSVQLAQAKEVEVLGKISTFVVHDLKNLVYTLSLIVDNARDYITDPEFQQDMLASLDNTVAKMKYLISRLKYLPEKGSLHKEPLDLLRLVEETAAAMNGTEIRIDGKSTVADVDRDEIQKVTLNLILNAVDATGGEGPVNIEVGGDDRAFIRVADEGCGIPEEYLRHHLFSPFRSTKKSGLGIGLYQCKHIVDAHGGSIDVRSEAGRGTEFTVWLPRDAELRNESRDL